VYKKHLKNEYNFSLDRRLYVILLKCLKAQKLSRDMEHRFHRSLRRLFKTFIDEWIYNENEENILRLCEA